ncbi:hypothetical protein EVAR_65963_1 [Eumeta japonica]|uniref:Uncharacterized protein n=1 Tax=Eumeta variegata TaxID=151549 RepID=A0A4C1Z793_EUMVA|nr:hypothetical protein EVAR_65963_1 [Eumeta japonica]
MHLKERPFCGVFARRQLAASALTAKRVTTPGGGGRTQLKISPAAGEGVPFESAAFELDGTDSIVTKDELTNESSTHVQLNH